MPTLTSKKQYLSTYMSLIKKAESEDLDKIFEYIKNANVKDTTKLSHLNSIISLKKIDSKLVKGDLSKIKEYRDNLNMTIENNRKENNVNEKQAKALDTVSLDDLKNFVTKLDENKNKSIDDLENYILVKMMVSHPVRNDLQEILLTRTKKDLQQPVNAIFVPTGAGKNAILSIKEYKTSKSGGDINIHIDEDLTNDIKKLMKDGRRWLFVNNKRQPFSSSSFTHKLNRIFKKEFGVPISSTLIRKIYLTGKYGNVANEMEKDAKIMGHSVQTQRDNYIRREEGDIKTKEELPEGGQKPYLIKVTRTE
jgi:integrase